MDTGKYPVKLGGILLAMNHDAAMRNDLIRRMKVNLLMD